MTDNPLFTELDQPRIGPLSGAAGLPVSIDGAYPPAVPAPALGDDTATVLADWLAIERGQIDDLYESGTVA